MRYVALLISICACSSNLGAGAPSVVVPDTTTTCTVRVTDNFVDMVAYGCARGSRELPSGEFAYWPTMGWQATSRDGSDLGSGYATCAQSADVYGGVEQRPAAALAGTFQPDPDAVVAAHVTVWSDDPVDVQCERVQ